jgi:ATP-dependent Lhr-like helicase
MIPSYEGGKFPLSTHLALRVRRMLADQRSGARCPTAVASGSACRPSARRSRAATSAGRDLPARHRHFLVVYPFEGRLAHQTLGMLLTRRLDRLGARPWVRRQRLRAGVWGLGDLAGWSARAGSICRQLFARTCWATTSMPGSPNRA